MLISMQKMKPLIQIITNPVFGIIVLAFLLFFLSYQSCTLFNVSACKQTPNNNNVIKPPAISIPIIEASFVKMASANIFGLSNAPIAQTRSNLNLNLMGTYVHSSKPATSLAIISDAGLEPKIYRIGDIVPANAKIKEITNEQVILEVAGRLESLQLPKNTLLASSNDKKAKDKTDSPKIESVSKSDIRSLKTALRIAPSIQNGVIAFKLLPGINPDLFYQLGLKSGDIVTAIDGIPFDTLEKAMSKLKSLNQPNAQLTIIREGEVIALNLDLTLLN